jgi:predicted ester cyclase
VAIVDELGAPTVLLYYPLTGELCGRDSLKQMIRQFRSAFPDASLSLEGDCIAEGDKVVARWKGVATQKSSFGSIPATGKSATWTGISIFRIADGQVAAAIGEEDALSVFQQLGLVPLLGHGGQ